MFMPKAICRLRLRVTTVRTQTLSAISHEESLAEGVDGIDDFAALWRTMYGNQAPEEQVTVIEFEPGTDFRSGVFNAK